MSSRILLVEDDERIRASIRLALEEEGYEVEEAPSGEEALDLFAEQPPDVALIDLMLPGMDGFECCRQIRRTSTVPVIVVTARTDTHDVVAGLGGGSRRLRDQAVRRKRALRPDKGALEKGAVARRTEHPHLRRRRGEPRGGYGPAEPASRCIAPVPSSGFCASWPATPGKVLSREQLLDRVWGYDYFGDGRLVDVHVRRLRTKIEPDPANPRHILTVRGMGYKLAT